MTELIIRPLRAGETDFFLSYPFPRQPELWETARDYAALVATGEYRPEHTWVAIRDGIVVARACWWAGPDDEHPAALDWLEAEPRGNASRPEHEAPARRPQDDAQR